MRINNNLMAMNTHRQLGINNTATSKSLEKLSSGFRINRAGDDAAGLAISEKMRGQIRGLNMASKNAQDGISLIQTAEGALTETHAILQRMRELAVQSANDTNVEVDRGEIQKEIDQLAAELTRIADTTEFNTQNLLGGKFNAKFHVGANEGQNVDLSINGMSAKDLGVINTEYTSVVVDELDITNLTTKEFNITTKTETEEVTEISHSIDVDTGNITFTLKSAASGTDITTTNQELLDYISNDAELSKLISAKLVDGKLPETAVTATTDKAMTAVVQDETKGGIQVNTQEDADKAITVINSAIETVSAERSKLGAMQNRLEHTIKNLDTSAENLQAAESRIRDVDMAKEMMEFTKQNILQQAATAMLAQANQAPQTVLQLLR